MNGKSADVDSARRGTDGRTEGRADGRIDSSRFQVLGYKEVRKLSHLLDDAVAIHGKGNFPTLEIKLRHLIAKVRLRLRNDGLEVRYVKLNGGAASHVIGSATFAFNDLDLIFGVNLSTASNGLKVKAAVLDSLVEFLPEDAAAESTDAADDDAAADDATPSPTSSSSSSPLRADPVAFKEAYVQKLVRVCSGPDQWSLISLSNNRGKNIELKFVDRMRRQFEFSVDSFQIHLDSLLQFFDHAPVPMTSDFYPTVVGESLYGDFAAAAAHLEACLIATTKPEEIRGGGLLKYCNLLVRDFRPADETSIGSLERYMCSRFFIDFPDVIQQHKKIARYLANHFVGDEATKFDFLMTLGHVIDASTVCLMGHERRQTLTLISQMSGEILQRQHLTQPMLHLPPPPMHYSMLQQQQQQQFTWSSSSAQQTTELPQPEGEGQEQQEPKQEPQDLQQEQQLRRSKANESTSEEKTKTTTNKGTTTMNRRKKRNNNNNNNNKQHHPFQSSSSSSSSSRFPWSSMEATFTMAPPPPMQHPPLPPLPPLHEPPPNYQTTDVGGGPGGVGGVGSGDTFHTPAARHGLRLPLDQTGCGIEAGCVNPSVAASPCCTPSSGFYSPNSPMSPSNGCSASSCCGSSSSSSSSSGVSGCGSLHSLPPSWIGPHHQITVVDLSRAPPNLQQQQQQPPPAPSSPFSASSVCTNASSSCISSSPPSPVNNNNNHAANGFLTTYSDVCFHSGVASGYGCHGRAALQALQPGTVPDCCAPCCYYPCAAGCGYGTAAPQVPVVSCLVHESFPTEECGSCEEAAAAATAPEMHVPESLQLPPQQLQQLPVSSVGGGVFYADLTGFSQYYILQGFEGAESFVASESLVQSAPPPPSSSSLQQHQQFQQQQQPPMMQHHQSAAPSVQHSSLTPASKFGVKSTSGHAASYVPVAATAAPPCGGQHCCQHGGFAATPPVNPPTLLCS